MTASDAHSILPSLSDDEERHSSVAAAMIREQISAAGGWMSFEKYMELALYAPGLGYYSAGSVKIGSQGDFVTAPEVSDLFSRCVARQCADVLAESGGGEILELGAGTGRMAATILEALADLGGAVPTRYAILEVSADLADRQRARIQRLPAALRDRVVWLESLPETPVRGVILANEVLDALPFQRFRLHDGKVAELGVALAGDAFVWSQKPQGIPAAADLIHELPLALPDGYVSEICLRTEPWIAGVGRCLDQGLLLLFDYGLPRAHYYHPQRTEGTLRCHFKQRAHDDPFINVAVQDITAWVDFTRVAEAALAADLEVSGFATQAAFLLGTGIEAMSAAAIDQEADPIAQARLAGEARRLLLPGEMGESFKALALTRQLQAPLRGFAYQDLRGSL
jgi:SAM-dependent MidA family methyltransferase